MPLATPWQHVRRQLPKAVFRARPARYSTGYRQTGEGRLLDSMRSLAQSGSPIQREALWGLYRRIAGDNSTGRSALSPTTARMLIELMVRDKDTTRALQRLSEILGNIDRHRSLTEDEVAMVQRICASLDLRHHHTPLDQSPVFADTAAHIESTQQPQLVSLIEGIRDAATPDLAKLRLQLLTKADPMATWKTYRALVDGDRLEDITKTDMTRVVDMCGSMGTIFGIQCLKQIEQDLETYPTLFHTPHAVLISTYALLGSIADSQRCYVDALGSEMYPNKAPIDWSMCYALFRGSRQREGREIFNQLVSRGEATPRMYSILLAEYTLMRNPARAFELFQDMRTRHIKPEYRAFCTLATACVMSAETNAPMVLSDVTADMKSWGYTPGMDFFICMLRGYHESGQDSMFDGLLSRLRLLSLQPDNGLRKVLLLNAMRRRDTDRVAVLSRAVKDSADLVPHIVRALCHVGEQARVTEIVDFAGFPATNSLENAKLEAAMYSPTVAGNPEVLINYAENMVKQGFTPSFRLFRDIVRHIWLHSGRDKAIQVYEKFGAMGMPKSIDMLSTAIQLYIGSRKPGRAVPVFMELIEWLSQSDLSTVSIDDKTLRRMMRLVILQSGIRVAHEIFGRLAKLPIKRAQLPYSTLIEFYVNHQQADRSRALISHVVQNNIPLTALAINLYCRYLAQESTVTDLANFLRYLSRTHTLDQIADDVAEKFFSRCAMERSMADFEWVTRALVMIRRPLGMWRRVLNSLGEHDVQTMCRMVQVVGECSEDPNRMMTVLLMSVKESPWRAAVADQALAVLYDQRVRVKKRVCEAAISAIVDTWTDANGRLGSKAPCKFSSRFLIEALERNIYRAISIGISPNLLTSCMLALASSSPPGGYKRCLGLLKTLSSDQQSIQHYVAVARGCARYGSIAGIDEVASTVRALGIQVNTPLINAFMHCYVGLSPPLLASSASVVVDTGYRQQVIEQFYDTCLDKVLSLFGDMQYQGCTPDKFTYTTMLQACANAGKTEYAEKLIGDMLAQGHVHDEVTALMWIRLRLKSGDVQGALSVFRALEDTARSQNLEAQDDRYRGLSQVRRTPMHFAVVIQHYADAGRYREALMLLKAMHGHGRTGETWMYSALLRRLMAADERTHMAEMLREMGAAGVVPDMQTIEAIKAYMAKSSDSTALDPT